MSAPKSPRPQFNLELYREDCAIQGWSWREFAKRANLPYSTVFRFLHGRNYSARTGSQLAAALGHGTNRYLIARRKSA